MRKTIICTMKIAAISIILISCNKEMACIPETISINIIDSWVINDSIDTVTFNDDGSGFSNEGNLIFVASNSDKNYYKFNWITKGDSALMITYDYSPDVPIAPYLVSETHTIQLNSCNEIVLGSPYNPFKLTK